MSTDTATAETAAPGTPTARGPRILKTTLMTVTLVAALIAVPTLAVWAWGPGRSSDLWSKQLADPGIALADGTAVPAGPTTMRTWPYRNTTYGLPNNTSILAAAFGGPVKQVKPGTWATATGTVTTPRNLASIANEPYGNSYGFEFDGPSVAARPGAATFHTHASQEREVRRILTALGWPHQADLAPVLYFDNSDAPLTSVVASPRAAGARRSAESCPNQPPGSTTTARCEQSPFGMQALPRNPTPHPSSQRSKR
jgi:hypothetical protein